MAVYVRAKRVTDPLDDKVKARLRGDVTGYASGGSSSGSDHEADLSGLVHAFFEQDSASGAGPESDSGEISDSDNDNDSTGADRAAQAGEAVRELLDPKGKGDLFRLRLYSAVLDAAGASSELRLSGSGRRRAVMARLREAGYNAGLCKARWAATGGVTAGSYEYIDVVSDGGGGEGRRYIVDLGFAAEFEVARATAEYRAFVAALPGVAVATAEEVRKAVRAAAGAARRSMRARGMHVPPWRKGKYMMAKWLGSYRRTTNRVPASTGAPAVIAAGDVKRRVVGFAVARRPVCGPT